MFDPVRICEILVEWASNKSDQDYMNTGGRRIVFPSTGFLLLGSS